MRPLRGAPTASWSVIWGVVPTTLVRVAFLTFAGLPELWSDDLLAAEALRARGHPVTPVVWNAPGALEALDGFDLCVVRSPWDWFHHRAAFRRFLDALGRARCRVVNDAATLRAFADKTYLPALAARGLAVVPTLELDPAGLVQVPELLRARGWGEAVLKPAFTANAIGARRVRPGDALTSLPELDAGEKWLLQPFIPSIARGEFSLVFFGGAFSHAVRKQPATGEWRVQHEYGGVSAPWAAPEEAVAQARALLHATAPGAVYARVDLVDVDGRLHLMELELVEPELFFRHEARAAARFADALGL